MIDKILIGKSGFWNQRDGTRDAWCWSAKVIDEFLYRNGGAGSLRLLSKRGYLIINIFLPLPFKGKKTSIINTQKSSGTVEVEL